MKPYFLGIYCDDIRREVGNKPSLMGCYASHLFVDEFPAALGKLSFHFRILADDAEKPLEQLIIRLKIGDDAIAEGSLDVETHDGRIDLTGGLFMENLIFSEKCQISSELIASGVCYEGPTLNIAEQGLEN